MSDDFVHGKPGTYTNGGCRCADCLTAWREYKARYRETGTHAVTGAGADLVAWARARAPHLRGHAYTKGEYDALMVDRDRPLFNPVLRHNKGEGHNDIGAMS